MDYRVLLAAALGLVLIAFGGFYYALSLRSPDQAAPSAKTTSAPAPGQAQAPAAPAGKATPASIEAEIASSDHAELQALLKRHFDDEYKQLIAIAVRRRNEGLTDDAFGHELLSHFQEIMRSKLKYAVAASVPLIDKLAANEAALFHALGTDGTAFCLTVLGKASGPVAAPMPESIRRLLRLGTLYRFQAIVEGMPHFKPVEALTADEVGMFQAQLARDGLKFEDVRSGAFLQQEGDGPGKPCLMIERLYRAIASLGEETRRKIYSGMFFLGRDR
jgi:hypothetical protein